MITKKEIPRAFIKSSLKDIGNRKTVSRADAIKPVAISEPQGIPAGCLRPIDLTEQNRNRGDRLRNPRF